MTITRQEAVELAEDIVDMARDMRWWSWPLHALNRDEAVQNTLLALETAGLLHWPEQEK